MSEGNIQSTHENFQSASSRLFVRPFEFLSPLPIDVCIERLQALQTESARYPVVCRVWSDVSPENAAMHFSLVKEVNIAQVTGSLNPSSELETFVAGCGKIPTTAYVAGGVVFVVQSIVFLFIALSGTPSCLILISVVWVGLLRMWRFCLTETDNLVEAIKEMLSTESTETTTKAHS